MAEVQKRMDSWAVDYTELAESQKVYIKSQIARFLAELEIGQDEVWEAAARLVGLSENFIEYAKRERQYLIARKEWKSYQTWLRERNPERAALEAQYGYDTKHAAHLVRLLRMGYEVLTTGQVNVWREDSEEILSVKRGLWTFDELVGWAKEQDATLDTIYRAGTYVVPKSPDKEALNTLCMELIEAFHKENPS